MHPYRTHTCGELRSGDEGQPARLSGWIHRKRDHGNLLFVDLRDHFGVTQCVIDVSSDLFPVAAAALRVPVAKVRPTLEADPLTRQTRRQAGRPLRAGT